MARSNKELSFVLSDEERARAQITEGGKIYSQNGANEFLDVVPTYVMMQQLTDIIDIFIGGLDWKAAPTFSQYFKPADHSEFPKYILYSGLDVNIDALVRVLGGA